MSAEIALNRQWAEKVFSEKTTQLPPFSFVYDGKSSSTFLVGWKRQLSVETIDSTKVCRTLTLVDPATKLEVRAVATVYLDTPGVDWTIYFTNNGAADTPVIEAVRAVDAVAASAKTEPAILHRLIGGDCSGKDWMPFDETLKCGSSIEFSTSGGRSSNVSPFFNLDWGDGGVITAIGWSGQWTASAVHDADGRLRMQAGMQYIHTILHPGESMRTPRIMQVYWSGSDQLRSYNLFRHTMFAHIMPRSRVTGDLDVPPIIHMSTSFYELNNSDETNVLSHLNSTIGLGFEAFWLDAYWHKLGFPDGMGNYGFPITMAEPADRFPNGIRPIGDAVAARNMAFILWFEPERVAANTYLAVNHPEWVLSQSGNGGLYNLGLQAARDHMTNYLEAVVDAYRITWLRIDYNIDPLSYWQYGDNDQNRIGITEIRYIEGLYKMWDDLRAYYPFLSIDNCASGGRRIDLETSSRSIPLWRTDATVGPLFSGNFDQSALQNQVMTAGLSRYVPFSLSGQMGWNPYRFRSGFNAGEVFAEDIRSTDYPKDKLAQAITEGKHIRKYYYGNFYPLSKVTSNDADWCVMQYHRTDLDDGMLMAFRRQLASADTFECNLREIDPSACYEVKYYYDYVSPQTIILPGNSVQHLNVLIPEKPGSVVIEYRKIPWDGRGLATIIGKVTSTLPGHPVVSDAAVTIAGTPLKAVTDSGGNYRLDLCSGTYTLECNSSGCGSVTASATIAPGQTEVENFLLPSGLLSGKVTATAPGQPAIYGADVRTESGISSVITDANGNYSLMLPPGNHNIDASCTGYQSIIVPITIKDGQITQQDFSLDLMCKYDVAKDFVTDTTGFGVWSYGWEKTLGSPLMPYTVLSNPAAGLAMWNIPEKAGADVAGFVWKNTNADASGQWGWTEPGQVCLHPGPQNQKATIRWTAPLSGDMKIDARFTGQSPSNTTTDVHVLRNGISLYDGNINGFIGRASNGYTDAQGNVREQSYLGMVHVDKDDIIDFSVGYGATDYSCDITGLSAEISELLTNAGSISGKVTANRLGQPPIDGARVEIGDGLYVTQTASDGSYSLAVPAGLKTIRVFAGGYKSAEEQVTVVDNSTTYQNFALDARTVWDASADFDDLNTSGSEWSCGWMIEYASVLSQYTNLSCPADGMSMWNMPGQPGADIAGFIWKNCGSAPCGQWGWTEPGQVCLHPGPGNQSAVLRWTSPISANVKINAKFTGQAYEGTTTDVHLLKNGSSIFDSNISGYVGSSANGFSDGFGNSKEQSYSAVIHVDKNDTIDFLVGYGNGSYNSDITGLSATITRLPEVVGLRQAASISTDSLVSLISPCVVTSASGVFADGFYVEDPNRIAGIKVISGDGFPEVALGDRITFDGWTGKDINGEDAILLSTVTSKTSGDALTPVGVSGQCIRADGGLSISGMFIRVWGKVTAVADDGSYFYIDDGTGLWDNTGNTGIRILPRSYTPPYDSYVSAVGISGLARVGTLTVPVVRTTTDAVSNLTALAKQISGISQANNAADDGAVSVHNRHFK